MAEVPFKRIPAIDGLRAFAVGIVFLFHLFPNYIPGGYLGVDIFFVISGFVITRSLTGTQLSFKRFYLHRFFRIFPPMVPVLLFAWFAFPHPNPLDFIGGIASVLNWLIAFDLTDGGVITHFWSLSVEEQFYFLWPLLFYILSQRQRSPVRPLMVLITVLIAWQMSWPLWAETHVRVYSGLDTRASQLLMGCLLALVSPRNLGKFWPIPTLAICVAVMTLGFKSPLYVSLGIPVIGLLTMLLVAVLAWAKTPLNRLFEHPLAQWGGSRSYALYLWHYPVLRVGVHYANAWGLSLLAVKIGVVALSCVAAEISYRTLERPMVGVRKRLEVKLAI